MGSDPRYASNRSAMSFQLWGTSSKGLVMSSPNASMPLLLSLGLVLGGLLIAAVSGLASGSLLGGLLAGAGLIPACYSAWLGVQKETQTTMLWSVLLIFASLGVGARFGEEHAARDGREPDLASGHGLLGK